MNLDLLDTAAVEKTKYIVDPNGTGGGDSNHLGKMRGGKCEGDLVGARAVACVGTGRGTKALTSGVFDAPIVNVGG